MRCDVTNEMRAKTLKRNSEIWIRNQKIIERNSNRTDGGQEELEELESVDIEDLHPEGLFLFLHKFCGLSCRT